MLHVEADWSSPLADGRRARVVVTDRRHGDLRVDQQPDVLEARRQALVGSPWTWLRQVHGSRVVTVHRPGEHAGETADGSCTRLSWAPLAVQAADCAPITLVADVGAIAVVHAGWRGLVAGILESAVDAMAGLGAVPSRAVVGPCIRPASYEFGAADLDRVAALYGDGVRSVTTWGAPALDLPAAVHSALGGLGVDLVDTIGGCTAEDATRWWSHRARGDRERQAMVAWIDETVASSGEGAGR